MINFDEIDRLRAEAFEKLDNPSMYEANIHDYLQGKIEAYDEVKDFLVETNQIDYLQDMLIKQDNLQKVVGTVYDVPFAKDMTLALIVELGEFLAETPFKNWSKKHLKMREDGCKFQPGREAAGLEELVDCFHFFLNLVNFSGMTAKDLWEAYNAKWEVNNNRQKTGY